MKNEVTIALSDQNITTYLAAIEKNESINFKKDNIALRIKRNHSFETHFVCSNNTVSSFMSSLGPALLNNSTITSLELGIASEEVSTKLGNEIFNAFAAVFMQNKTLTSLQLPKTSQSNCATFIVAALGAALLSSNSVAIREIKLDGLNVDNAPLLKTALNKNLITELSFDSEAGLLDGKTGVVDEKILSELLEIIAVNNSLKILHLPSKTKLDYHVRIKKPFAWLECNQSLRELHIRIPTELSFALGAFKNKPRLKKFCLNYTNAPKADNHEKAVSRLSDMFLRNFSLESASIDSSDSKPLCDSLYQDNQLVAFRERLIKKHRHITYFIGMLSLLSPTPETSLENSLWHCFPADIQSLIWYFWQMEFPMEKTFQQINHCVRIFRLPETGSFVRALVRSTPQGQPIQLFKHLEKDHSKPEIKEVEPTLTSGLRIML